MRRISPTLTLLLLAAVASAQAREYRPWVDEVLISRCRSIVVARLDRITVMPNKERLARFHVKETLKGSEGDSVLVIGAGDETTSFRELDKLLFLETTRGGTMRVLVDLVDLPREDGDARLTFLRRSLLIIRRNERSRAISLKRLALDHVRSRSAWVRRVVVREIVQLVRFAPRVWTSADLIELQELDVADLGEDEARRLRTAILAVEEETATRWTRSQLVFPDEETRRSFLADLATFERGGPTASRVEFLDAAARTLGRRVAPLFVRHLDDADDAVAVKCAELTGEMESGAGVAALVAIARGRRAPAVRAAAVEALGKIGAPKSVPALVSIAQRTGDLHRDVLTALATINTADAALWLRDYDETLREDEGSDPELRRFVSHLRSDAFRTECGLAHSQRVKSWR